jgi:hypothetical protein
MKNLALVLLLTACSGELAPADAGPGSPADGAWTVQDAEPVQDGGWAEPDAGSDPSADAGPPDTGSDGGETGCWVSRNVNVRWERLAMNGCAAFEDAPLSLITTVRAPCDVEVGTVWTSGASTNDPCDRVDGTSRCDLELVYSAALDGEALWRAPAVGDEIVMSYDTCRVRWRAERISEGPSW